MACNTNLIFGFTIHYIPYGIDIHRNYSPYKRVKYYRENLVNYLTDIFKKFDPKFAKQIKDDIASGEFNLKTEGETAVGFRLTQEMKDKIRAAGVPTFGVAGGIGLTNFMLQDDERQQPTSLLGGI